MRLFNIFITVLALLLFTFYFLFSRSQVFAQQIDCTDRQACERRLLELENQISGQEAQIVDYQKRGRSLQNEINNLNAKINKANLQIKSINLSLAKLDEEITETRGQIQITEQKLNLNKEALRRAIRAIYQSDRTGLTALFLKSERLSDFVGNVNNLVTVQRSLITTVNAVAELQGKLIVEREDLELKRSDALTLKRFQDAQRVSLRTIKDQKAEILTVTKGQESKFQSLLKEARKTAAQIRSRIFEFLGGGELTFEKAYEFAKFAEQATGARAALILAVLDKESALGQNVGRCNYKTAMHPTRDIHIFLALTAALNINPDTITVSCANRDGLFGGAMGPAQFIPSTWNLYSAKVAESTGSNPPSPWRHGDAFMATALYLKDSMRGCDSLYSHQTDIERCAAAKYYAGGRWRRHLWGYGDRVVTKAQQFQTDIDVLSS